jgi:hypothetical protein
MPAHDSLTPHSKVRPVLSHWQDLQQRHGALPRRHDLDPCAFMPCLGDMMLLAVLDGGADYRYDLVGENVRNLFGVAYVHRTLRQIGFAKHEILIAEYQSVVRNQAPLYLERRQISERNFMEIIIGKLILPLSDDGRRVSDLLVCLACIG